MDLEQWQKDFLNLDRQRAYQCICKSIYYVKYKNEKREDKAIKELINKEGVAEELSKRREE